MAGRTALTMPRSPQVLGIAVRQALMFRFVIGRAIDLPGVTYVNYVVPGLVVAGLLFTAGGSAVAIATLDHDLGYYVTGSLLWSLALTAVTAPLALRAYRRD